MKYRADLKGSPASHLLVGVGSERTRGDIESYLRRKNLAGLSAGTWYHTVIYQRIDRHLHPIIGPGAHTRYEIQYRICKKVIKYLLLSVSHFTSDSSSDETTDSDSD